ncbi:hypothetical protein [Tannockella kyphosi]|uniref:hypothetical protein n=1 Tax=Tannockella kyphosi TaxID=2899121 RepID=UPI002011EF3A|nr:hypothetical protein [Tannockella kyphosi]
MSKFKNMMYRFAYGRYGHDQLSSFILVISIVLIVINLVIGSAILSSFVWVILMYNVYRTYSKKIYARRQENETYLRMTKPIRKRVELVKKQQADKSHKYLLCKNCLRITRVPKGKGKISVTCPNCKTKFNAKS